MEGILKNRYIFGVAGVWQCIYIYTGDAGVVFSYVCTQVYSGLSRQTNLPPFPHPLSIPSMIFNRRTEKASSHEEFKVVCLPNRQTNAKGVHRWRWRRITISAMGRRLWSDGWWDCMYPPSLFLGLFLSPPQRILEYLEKLGKREIWWR